VTPPSEAGAAVMKRVFNFSAGPAAVPEAVLDRVRDELYDWQGLGMSVMEVSHRGAEFEAVAAHSEARLRELLAIPANYKVLFLSGGATMQFAGVPLNLTTAGAPVDYVVTGSWGKKAAGEAARYCTVKVAADGAAGRYTAIPPLAQWRLDPQAAYVHYTPNETIGGVEFHAVPDTGRVPLVADMSSTILSRPIDVGRFGVIYAGAQKNLGIAGLTVVIVRDDLIGHARRETPSILDYAAQAADRSLLNTPATFVWYVLALTLDWVAAQGGVSAMGERNAAKAQRLYAAIDRSGFYANPIDPPARSWMNVPFTLADANLDQTFLAEAKGAGLANLKGHRSVGGMRASIYNAMPEAGVSALIDFMADFERRHG
jgi:phosphoserine aminotransferase